MEGKENLKESPQLGPGLLLLACMQRQQSASESGIENSSRK